MQQSQWSESVILIDADYADRVAFDLTVNFERMLERRVPPADLARWLDCLALDGGLRPGDNAIQAIFLHHPATTRLRCFNPGGLKDELDGKAFRDNLGEFTLHSFAAEDIVTPIQFFVQSIEAIAEAPAVKRLMVVGDTDNYAADLRKALLKTSGKDVTLFTMQPMTGGALRTEILGYSLMSALGVSAEELG